MQDFKLGLAGMVEGTADMLIFATVCSHLNFQDTGGT